MTNLEAYKAIFNRYGYRVSDADAAADLGLSGTDPAGEYNPAQNCLIYAPALSRLYNDNIGVQSVSDGGTRIIYDKDNKLRQLYQIAQDSGCGALIDKYNPNPKVKNKSFVW